MIKVANSLFEADGRCVVSRTFRTHVSPSVWLVPEYLVTDANFVTG